MSMFGMSLLGSLILINFIIEEYHRLIPRKSIYFQVIITSVIQCIYTVIYISRLYLDSNLYIYLALILLIVICITGHVMYKWQIKLSYWLSLNLIISPSLSFALIQLDTSIFDRPFGGMAEGLTPILSVVYSIILQVSIWLFVKFQKWVNNDLQKEKVSLRHSITTYVKIIGFQVLLSVLLESVFIFYNVVLSSIAIILAIVAIFIVRDKLGGNYSFWIISWLGVCYIAVSIVVKHFPYPSTSIEETMMITRYQFEVWVLFGLAIYHLLLTIYYKLMEEYQMPEEL